MRSSIPAAMVILLIVTTSAALAFAQPTTQVSDADSLGAALREGGYVIFFRHALEDGEDQNPVDLEDCDTQQYLTDEGSAQARAIGEQFRTLGIPVGQVLSSQFCRAYETAVLAFGAPDVLDVLTPGGSLPPATREAQPNAIRRLLATPPEAGTNTILVSHNGVLNPITGVTVERAEGAIFAPDGAGGFALVTILGWDEWSDMALSD